MPSFSIFNLYPRRWLGEGKTTLKKSRVLAMNFFDERALRNKYDRVSFQIIYQIID